MRERAAGTTVSILTVFSFYGAEDYCKRGRFTWVRSKQEYIQMNTQLEIKLKNGTTLTFRFSAEGHPTIEASDGSNVHADTDATKSDFAQVFFELIDFSQYSEHSLHRNRPPKFVPMEILLLVALCHGQASTDMTMAAILMYLGPTLRNDRENGVSTWYTYTHSKRWTKDGSDLNAKTMIRAAATDLERILKDLTNPKYRGDFASLYYLASSVFFPRVDDAKQSDDDKVKESKSDDVFHARLRGRSKEFMPSSERAKAAFVAEITPWVSEHGITKSFEENKHIDFENGVLMGSNPHAFVQPTPGLHVIVKMGCNLLPQPKNEQEVAELEDHALRRVLPLFGDNRAVALRELDKVAVTFSGSCEQMPEANLRPVCGPFNEETGRYATRCGKNVLMKNVIEPAIGDDNFETGYPPSFLTMQMDGGKSYSFLKDIERKLAHWVDEGEHQGADRKQIPLSSNLKRIYAGGKAAKFPYRCEHEKSTVHQLRTNCCYWTANSFSVGSAPDFWSKLEVTPLPKCGNIPENQYLIDNGCPTFEIDPTLTSDAMSKAEREKIICYLIYRMLMIKKNPSAAHPVTELHVAAKKQLMKVAGGPTVDTARMTEEDAQKQLASACQLLLKPCEPRDDRSSSTIAENRNAFQGKGESGAHCYCGKKAASNACSFTGPAFSDRTRIF